MVFFLTRSNWRLNHLEKCLPTAGTAREDLNFIKSLRMVSDSLVAVKTESVKTVRVMIWCMTTPTEVGNRLTERT